MQERERPGEPGHCDRRAALQKVPSTNPITMNHADVSCGEV
jgi:hypothetical protein